MKLYHIRWVQILLSVMYSAACFAFLAAWNDLSPWVPIAVFLLFCALWGHAGYVLLSTGIMVVTAVPIWWFSIAPHQIGHIDVVAWYPLIIVNFIVYVLLPEIILVWGRNAVIRKFAA